MGGAKTQTDANRRKRMQMNAIESQRKWKKSNKSEKIKRKWKKASGSEIANRNKMYIIENGRVICFILHLFAF